MAGRLHNVAGRSPAWVDDAIFLTLDIIGSLTITCIIWRWVLGRNWGFPNDFALKDFLDILGIVFAVFTVVLAKTQHIWKKSPKAIQKRLAKEANTYIVTVRQQLTGLKDEFNGTEFSRRKIIRFANILTSCENQLRELQYLELNRVFGRTIDCEPCLSIISKMRTNLFVVIENEDTNICFPKYYFNIEIENLIKRVSQLQPIVKVIRHAKK